MEPLPHPTPDNPTICHSVQTSTLRCKIRLSKRLLVFLVVAIAAPTFGYFVATEGIAAWQVRDAARKAAQDISLRTPRYLNYGERAPYENEAVTMLWQRYDVRVERVAGCEVSESLRRRCDAYNRVVSFHFGFTGERDIFLSAVDELIALGKAGSAE